MVITKSISLYKNIKALIENSRQQILYSVNTRIVETYFEIGKSIINYEQQGKSRAAYANRTLKSLSVKLTKLFGRGFSVDNPENMRRFYFRYNKSDTLSRISSSKSSSSISETVSRISLCKNKKESIVKYTLPKNNSQIFTSKYKIYLPDKKELQQLMEAETIYKVLPKHE